MLTINNKKGHVFRKSTPYSFPGGTSLIVNKNNARLVDVWLDEWKEFYYNINPGNHHHNYLLIKTHLTLTNFMYIASNSLMKI